MYHKAKCRARLATRYRPTGDVIHVSSAEHTHKPMYTDAELEIMKKQNLLHQHPQQLHQQIKKLRTGEHTVQHPMQTLHLQQLQLRPFLAELMPTLYALPTQYTKQ
ncbi:uncharacterized protein pre-mod(mdg4)-AD [Eurosta solidaginis]|uniref:uncharacterized protein pre-mod(mdg4)-AD n=1 Tax=Eurosta solidaginis TaxID=178769 RepID=UPI003530DE91